LVDSLLQEKLNAICKTASKRDRSQELLGL